MVVERCIWFKTRRFKNFFVESVGGHVRQWPLYLKLSQDEWRSRIKAGFARLEACDVCPRKCGVNRLKGEHGVCRTGEYARVSSYCPHMGEELPLTGWRGSGTIFFARCNLRCQFCQNSDISQTDAGREVGPPELARIMLMLQAEGCHNINLVTPTHVVPQIIAAVSLAAEGGLRIPLVYNTGGYDSIEMLRLLDGIVDIYMPDMKYASVKSGRRYSLARSYPRINRLAVREMFRQVGNLKLDGYGLATRGLLVRHLILPNNLAGTRSIVHFLACEISPGTYLNLMDQYHPCYRASRFPELDRRITTGEYEQAVQLAREAGLHRLDEC
jgi:putative pyruvate formate lyase activating enzyme